MADRGSTARYRCQQQLGEGQDINMWAVRNKEGQAGPSVIFSCPVMHFLRSLKGRSPGSRVSSSQTLRPTGAYCESVRPRPAWRRGGRCRRPPPQLPPCSLERSAPREKFQLLRPRNPTANRSRSRPLARCAPARRSSQQGTKPRGHPRSCCRLEREVLPT